MSSEAALTFLFTDIEGSTALWERHPDRMHGALARHDALARRTVQDQRMDSRVTQQSFELGTGCRVPLNHRLKVVLKPIEHSRVSQFAIAIRTSFALETSRNCRALGLSPQQSHGVAGPSEYKRLRVRVNNLTWRHAAPSVRRSRRP